MKATFVGNENTFVVPFRFQITVEDEPGGERDDLLRSLQRAAAWSRMWAELAVEVATPAMAGLIRPVRSRDIIERARVAGGPSFQPLPLAMVHPLALLTNPDVDWRERHFPPLPAVDFAFELAVHPGDPVRRGPQIFCVGVAGTIRPGAEILFECGFDEFVAWTGSTNTEGRGGWGFRSALLSAALGALLSPIGAVVIGDMRDSVQTTAREVRIERSYRDAGIGSHCHVSGRIEFDVSALRSLPDQHLNVWAAHLSSAERHRRVCNLQAALVALTGRPLAVDGEFGPRTIEALQSFKRDWHLVPSKLDDPSVVEKLAAALSGQTPPE